MFLAILDFFPFIGKASVQLLSIVNFVESLAQKKRSIKLLHGGERPVLLAGNFPGGIATWQHPAISASLFPLPEAGGLQDPGGIAKQSPIPVFGSAGLNSQQGTQA